MPVKKDLGEGVFRFKGGAEIPKELFQDEPTQAAIDSMAEMSEEQVYEMSLRLGLPRNSELEATLDMSKVDLEVSSF